MKRYGILTALSFLVLFTYPAQTASAEAQKSSSLALIVVESGKYERIDTPVSVSLKGLPQDLSNDNIRLVEINGSQRKPIPVQIEAKTGRLWWILSGRTVPQTHRLFELEKGQPQKTPIVEAVKNESILEIICPDQKVLCYNHAPVEPPKGADKKYMRSGFIHPLWSPRGEMLTNIHPADHIHHLGIWMPWTKTKFEGREIDFWNLKNGRGTVRFVDFIALNSGPVFGGFQALHHHVDLTAPGGEKVALNEIWNIRVYNVGGTEKGYWLLDFVSTQRCASESPLQLLKYRYGGLGFRGAAQWEGDNGYYLTSEGKTRKDGHATRARWCDVGGVVGKKGEDWAGVVFMSHPKNHQHPEPMRIWPTGQVFFNFTPVQTDDWTLEPGKDYIFRYRLYVHEGKVSADQAQSLWKDYAEPPSVRLAQWVK